MVGCRVFLFGVNGGLLGGNEEVRTIVVTSLFTLPYVVKTGAAWLGGRVWMSGIDSISIDFESGELHTSGSM